MQCPSTDKARVLLLLPTRTYRATDFLDAALQLNVEVVIASEEASTTADLSPRQSLVLDFDVLDVARQAILDFNRTYPLAAIVGVDEETTVLAAAAAEALGLPHNPIAAVEATVDKYRLRHALASSGIPGPAYERVSVSDDPTELAARVSSGISVSFPCVLKPLSLSASRGVIRVDTPGEFIEAFHRIARLLGTLRASKQSTPQFLLVEDYIPGVEVAFEGILLDGVLKGLALFDKPDPLEGPFFEETLYITPSRLPADVQEALYQATSAAADALGLRHGPVHAELRYNVDGVQLLEIAVRTIGGLCAKTLQFGAGLSLEALVIRHAIGEPVQTFAREQWASGVMMIPIPQAGILRAVCGKMDAHRVDGIVDIHITIPIGGEVVPLPEGARYLGFIFARAETPAAVEAALRESHCRLDFVIESEN